MLNVRACHEVNQQSDSVLLPIRVVAVDDWQRPTTEVASASRLSLNNSPKLNALATSDVNQQSRVNSFSKLGVAIATSSAVVCMEDSFQDKQSKPMDSNATIRMNEDLLDTNHNSIAISSQLISLGGKLVASGDCASSGYGPD
ncbi:hypothetical protein OUZ56_003186 [Daphnia magna]|uniref:Uncharacterized protein n=1 Tax=Daphnia magna TaxID=35525 RepID=A0ABR0A7Z9_9CRUS|nr:hypothetical protein OUZ56_003186 [Daphnia magna]